MKTITLPKELSLATTAKFNASLTPSEKQEYQQHLNWSLDKKNWEKGTDGVLKLKPRPNATIDFINP